MPTTTHQPPFFSELPMIRQLAQRIALHESNELSPMDAPYLDDLVSLGNQAEAITSLANTIQGLYSLVCDLHGHCHFDLSGCESVEEYADLKAAMRHFVETGDLPASLKAEEPRLIAPITTSAGAKQ